jgi:lysophospholipase L1-like esterase
MPEYRSGGVAVSALSASEKGRAARAESRPVKLTGVRLLVLLLAVGAAPDAGTARSLRYLALGDSFTAGTGSSPDLAFPSQLKRALVRRGADVRLENVARNGFTTSDLIADELPALERFHPDTVTLAVGANDLVRVRDLDVYRQNLQRIFAAVVKAGVAPKRIVVLPQPDWSSSPVGRTFGEPDALRRNIERYNAVLKEEAAAVGAVYVDLFPLFVQQAKAGLVCADGLHPSSQAYTAWADALVEPMLAR